MFLCFLWIVRCSRRNSLADAVDAQMPRGHFYQASDKRMTFDKAKQYAESLSYGGVKGHLLTVGTTTEAQAGFEFLRQRGLNDNVMWLALTDATSEGTWVFDHGPEKGQAATGMLWWGGSEPNGGTGENCAYIMDSFSLTDIACSREFAFVVEFECPTGQYLTFEFSSSGSCVGMFVCLCVVRPLPFRWCLPNTCEAVVDPLP
jgi:hypothetical protein